MDVFKKRNFRYHWLDLQFMVFLITCVVMILDFPMGRAELTARSLDALLQERAFRSLARPKTGVPYDGNLPSGLAGIGVSALRLRSGSMRRKGYKNFHEFGIPIGVLEQPFVERVILVYHNLGNWSSVYYPLPEGYIHLTPVLGLLAYDASNLSASNLPELELRASENPMTIDFSRFRSRRAPLSAKCAFFDLHGSLEFDNVVDGNICRGTKHGYFSMVVEFAAPELAPANSGDSRSGGEDKNGCKKILWVIFGTVIGGVVVLVLLIVVLICTRKCRRWERIRRMEEASKRGVPLPMTNVGHTKAPVASETRTRPLLENEYVG